MHSAAAPTLSCRGRVGHRARSPWSFPQAPSTPGKARTLPGEAANKALCAASPRPHGGAWGSLQPGQGRDHAQRWSLGSSPKVTRRMPPPPTPPLGSPRGAAACQPARAKAAVPAASLTGCSPPTSAACGSGAPRRWRSAACPWSSPSGWAAACSRLPGPGCSTPPATSCGSACPRSRTPAG